MRRLLGKARLAIGKVAGAFGWAFGGITDLHDWLDSRWYTRPLAALLNFLAAVVVVPVVLVGALVWLSAVALFGSFMLGLPFFTVYILGNAMFGDGEALRNLSGWGVITLAIAWAVWWVCFNLIVRHEERGL
jgi:hypothetical protein